MKDPLIISSIIMAFAFLLISIINFKVKSKFIDLSFLIFNTIYIILIIIFDNNFIYEFLKSMITYIWYPNYLLFIITILISIIIFSVAIINKKMLFFNKLISYVLFCILICCYLIFIRLDIDPNLYSSLYQTKSLVIMRIANISLISWLLIKLIYTRIRKELK